MTRRILLFLLLSVSFAVAQPKVEKIGAFSGETSQKVKSALQAEGYRVYLPNTLVGCEIWLAKSVALAKRDDAKDAMYPDFADSEFLGVITFPKGSSAADFRGQPVRAGSYTMRYQLLPDDGNHMGVSPNPDFVLLIPIASDQDPAAEYAFGKLVELSASSARSSHPAAFLMTSAESGEPSVTQTDDGWVVFHGAIESNGKKVPVSIVVKGSAT